VTVQGEVFGWEHEVATHTNDFGTTPQIRDTAVIKLGERNTVFRQIDGCVICDDTIVPIDNQ